MSIQVSIQPSRLLALVAYSLFFSMLFVPTTYQPVKAGLLVVLLGAVAFAVATKRIELALHPSVLRWLVVLIGTGTVFILLGYWNGSPGALRVVTVYLLWPLIFGVLIAAIPSTRWLHSLLGVMVVAGIALGLYGAMYFAHEIGTLPAFLYIELDQGQAIGLYNGVVEYNMYSIASLIFLTPFFYAALLRWYDANAPLARSWLWLAYALCFALAILSGRRALWLILASTPVICTLLFLFQSQKQWSTYLALVKRSGEVVLLSAVVFVALIMVFDLSPQRMVDHLLAGFPEGDPGVDTGVDPGVGPGVVPGVGPGGDPGVDPGASLRYQQAVALIQGWLESPWLGHGHGAVASIVRSEEMPWAYELQYLALLFHTGILGTLLYAGCIGWIYWQGVRAIRVSPVHGRIMFPLLVGLTCFLVANATNPYLLKFDFMWVVFLPLAVINRFIIEQDGKRQNP